MRTGAFGIVNYGRGLHRSDFRGRDHLGGIVLGMVAAVILALIASGVFAIAVDRLFAGVGLAIAYLGLCGWLLIAIGAALAILVVVQRMAEGRA